MQVSCVVIEDEPLAVELLVSYISRLSDLRLVGTFTDSIEGRDFVINNQVDLLFIDINMPDLNGIEVVKSLKRQPLIIFTTAHKNYAVEGFQLAALDYLVKPISFERFEHAVQRALSQLSLLSKKKPTAAESLFVRSEYKLVKISFNEIEFIESMEDYCKIHLANSRPVMTLMTMKAIHEKLPADQFVRIHRSFIVSLRKVKSIKNKKVKLTSVELPVGDSYAPTLMQMIDGKNEK
jgi:two-component system, LytTR family, response regulator